MEAGGTEREEIARFLATLSIASIRRRSQLTPQAAEMLANEVKTAAWKRVQHLFPER